MEDIPTHMSLICPGAFNETLIWVTGPTKRPLSKYWGTIDLRLRVFDLKFFLRVLTVGTDRAASPLCQSKTMNLPGGMLVVLPCRAI